MGGPLGHTWSLSIDEKFYLTWPLVFALASKKKLQGLGLPLLTRIAATASAVFRAVHSSLYHNWNRVYFGLDTRADALLWGCLAGLLVFRTTPSAALEGWGILGLVFGAFLSTQKGLHLQVVTHLVSVVLPVSVGVRGADRCRRPAIPARMGGLRR